MQWGNHRVTFLDLASSCDFSLHSHPAPRRHRKITQHASMGGKPCNLDEDQLEEAGPCCLCEDFLRHRAAHGRGVRSKHAVRVHVKSTTTVKMASGVNGKVRPVRHVHTALVHVFVFVCESQGWTDCTKTCRGGFRLSQRRHHACWEQASAKSITLLSYIPCRKHVMSTDLLHADRIERVVLSVFDAASVHEESTKTRLPGW